VFLGSPIYQHLREGITCIDANYGRHGLACFYLLEHGGECAIIETGTANSIANLQQCMADKNLSPEQIKYIIPTHVHLDHAGGAGAMMALFENATLIIHPRGARHMIEPQRLVASSIDVYGERAFRELYGDIVPVDRNRIVEAPDGYTLDLSGRELLVRHTPGHADHHFCLWDAHSEGWFSGDMFGVSYSNMRFAIGDFLMASTTPTQFRPDAFLQSVKMLQVYSPSYMYLTHYGELAYSDALARLLCQQVEDYATFAQDDTQPPESLEQRIVDYTLGLLAPFDPTASKEALRLLIEFDVRLNVQGLAVWRARMNKAAMAN
jgi:glyoxylase-like metal-dependent hydrolase (beta-lactamase superfamily II)